MSKNELTEDFYEYTLIEIHDLNELHKLIAMLPTKSIAITPSQHPEIWKGYVLVLDKKRRNLSLHFNRRTLQWGHNFVQKVGINSVHV